jgi:hypothetical protein
MPVKVAPVVDSLDQVAEPFREAYEEREGKFYLSKEIEVEDLPSVAGLKSAHNRNASELKILKEKMKAYDGVDPDEFQTLKTEAEQRRANGGKDPEREAIVNGLKQQHEKELSKRDQLVLEKTERAERLVKRTAIRDAFDKVPVNSKPLVEEFLMKQVKADVDEKGEDIVRVVDKNGNPRFSKRTGAEMTVEELLLEMRENDEYKALFPGSGASGAGAQGSGRGAPAPGKVRVTRAEYSNSENYQRLKEEAKKVGKTIDQYVTVVDDE